MADAKISQLTGATTPLAGTEVLPIVQSGVTKKVAVSDLTAGRAVAMAGITNSGNADLGASADSLTSGGRTTRVSGKSVTNNGSSWFGSYGELIWNANAAASGSARRYSMVNGLNYTNMAFMRSVDANTDPALNGNGGIASSGSVDFTWTIDGYFLIGYTASNGGYPLQVNGQIFATSSTIATSDGRYKENVIPLQGSLDLVMALKPVQFNWKAHAVHGFDPSIPTIGFIAQDVAEVLADKPYLNSVVKRSECVLEPEVIEVTVIEPAIPEVRDDKGEVVTEGKDAVTTSRIVKEAVKEDFYGIAEGNLIALLTNAIQELKTEFDAYKASHP